MDATRLDALKAGEPFNFRPGPALGPRLASLVDEVKAHGGNITPTEMMRDGLLGCWDQVRTHLLVRHTSPATAAPDVARLVAIGQRALEQGLTPDQVEEHFTRLIEQRLSTGPST